MGGGSPLALIAGPCVIESRKGCLGLAARLAAFAEAEGVPLIFKASFDKANRSAGSSYRGPGLEAGLEVLAEVKARYGLPLLTDIHAPEQAAPSAAVVDILQIPAFLCRQTDLVVAAAETGKPVNLKKAQFLAPWDMKQVVAKAEDAGNRKLILTERGSCFGYNNLVADLRSLPAMAELGYPVVFDATHSVQRPGGGGNFTAGDGKWAPALARAAVAMGCDGVFIETHVNPKRALSDRENAVPFARLPALWRQLRAIHHLVHGRVRP
jgi:2-dehydro-3-deoxyphosphooctonate aldolase (KDO 8-P synthase)